MTRSLVHDGEINGINLTNPSTQHRVLIIGAGLAGLALGQGLNKAKFPFHIFERDSSAAFRAQGYRIRISPEGAGALQHLLPEHLWKAFEATCATLVHGGHRLDAVTGEGVVWQRPAPPTQAATKLQNGRVLSDNAYNADRAVLRTTLMSGLEKHISFGKRFESYEISSTGEVVVHFRGGTSERGRFVVGADGVRSVVRKQLLPDFDLLDTEGRAVFGKTEITDKLLSMTVPQMGKGICLVGESEESRIKLFTDGMQWDNRERDSALARKLGISLPNDYIYWVLVFRKDLVSADEEQSLLSLSNAQSAQLATEMTAHWNEKLRVLCIDQIAEAASTLAFLTSPIDFANKWTKPVKSRSHVTLVGDSAHAMPPVGGVGANAGFEDAADLCDTLSKYVSITEERERENLIGQFEHHMLQRTKAAVERSSIGAGHFFGMKPFSELKPATVLQ